MRERPIIFSAPMVRAILDGRKTQTRRLVKGLALEWLQPGRFEPRFVALPENHLCPYGAPGDRLWVREAWQVARETLDYETGGEYDVWEWPRELGDPRQHLNGDARFGTKAGLFYAADGEGKNPGVFYDLLGLNSKTVLRQREITWRPSIHMPRWASRITLEIEGVRVERLQDISSSDAISEGIEPCPRGGEWRNYLDSAPNRDALTPRVSFRSLWESINGPSSWDANPYVWAVSFRRIAP